jgi:hypothetical protein
MVSCMFGRSPRCLYHKANMLSWRNQDSRKLASQILSVEEIERDTHTPGRRSKADLSSISVAPTSEYRSSLSTVATCPPSKIYKRLLYTQIKIQIFGEASVTSFCMFQRNSPA